MAPFQCFVSWLLFQLLSLPLFRVGKKYTPVPLAQNHQLNIQVQWLLWSDKPKVVSFFQRVSTDFFGPPFRCLLQKMGALNHLSPESSHGWAFLWKNPPQSRQGNCCSKCPRFFSDKNADKNRMAFQKSFWISLEGLTPSLKFNSLPLENAHWKTINFWNFFWDGKLLAVMLDLRGVPFSFGSVASLFWTLIPKNNPPTNTCLENPTPRNYQRLGAIYCKTLVVP